MKFAIGSETDSAHCIALKHEFLRCEDAFKEFEKSGTSMIMMAQEQEQAGVPTVANESRLVAFKTYNVIATYHKAALSGIRPPGPPVPKTILRRPTGARCEAL